MQTSAQEGREQRKPWFFSLWSPSLKVAWILSGLRGYLSSKRFRLPAQQRPWVLAALNTDAICYITAVPRRSLLRHLHRESGSPARSARTRRELLLCKSKAIFGGGCRLLEELFPRCFCAPPVHPNSTHRPPDGGSGKRKASPLRAGLLFAGVGGFGVCFWFFFCRWFLCPPGSAGIEKWPGLSRGELAVGAAGRCPPPRVLKLPAEEGRSAPPLRRATRGTHPRPSRGGIRKAGKGPSGRTAEARWSFGPGPGGSRAAALSPQAPSGVFTLRPLLRSEGGSSCGAPVGKTSCCSLKHVGF